MWEGLEGDDVNSFLPLGSTPEFPGRKSVELQSNTCGIFKGTSLIFLEVERVVSVSSLGHPVGDITPEGLELVRAEREVCAAYWRQQSRERQVYAGRWKQSYIPRTPSLGTNLGPNFGRPPYLSIRPRASSFASQQTLGKSESKGEVDGKVPNRRWSCQ